MTDTGAPVGPGSHEPDPQAVPALTGFDPSRETIQSIAAWCNETFGPAGAFRIARRAAEEMKELIDETPADEWTEQARIEAADVLIILLRTPRIWEAVEQKMAVNRARKWRLTGDGCGYHISDSDGSRNGGDGLPGSVHDGADPKGIANTEVDHD